MQVSLKMNEQAERIEQLEKDIENGFMKGAYARLKELQNKENKYDNLKKMNKKQAERIEQLEDLLKDALPKIQRISQEDSNLITAIGQALKE
jgi:DNA-binding ferritin-like protein